MTEYIDNEIHYQACDEQEDEEADCICTHLKQDRQDEEDNNAVDRELGN